MTLPDERYRAIKQTEKFLIDLCSPATTPRVPPAVRERARGLLRHYPGQYHIDCLAAAAPDVIVKEMEPVHRFVAAGQQPLDNSDQDTV